ncbi:hypothetical protein TNCV_859421 [Trichonephila clavipes]|nr:hypothetical protein TNCV_859421 [Trichonephila clavipes]
MSFGMSCIVGSAKGERVPDSSTTRTGRLVPIHLKAMAHFPSHIGIEVSLQGDFQGRIPLAEAKWMTISLHFWITRHVCAITEALPDSREVRRRN